MDEPMKEACKVVIFDDQTPKAQRLRDAVRSISPTFDVHAPSIEEIEDLFDRIYARRDAIDASRQPDMAAMDFDTADVLIVDFDLRDLKDHRGFATGEEIAYSARLFSLARVIVVLNHPNVGLNNFDLTFQRDREFRADVYLGYEQCNNPGLWLTDVGHRGFLPWSWTPLPEDARTFEACVEQMKKNLDSNVLSYFELDRADTRPSPEILAYLGLKRDEDRPIRDLLKTANYVRQRDLEPLVSDTDRYARVVTALLRRWLRRWIVPVQSLLVDLPHLATLLPWGLKNYKDRTLFDQMATCGRSLDRCDLSKLVVQQVSDAAFLRPEWIGRPTYYLPRVRSGLGADKSLIAAFKASDVPRIAFAEDLSRFIDFEQALEYSVTLDGDSQVRTVAAPRKVPIEGEAYGMKGVVYTPESLIL